MTATRITLLSLAALALLLLAPAGAMAQSDVQNVTGVVVEVRGSGALSGFTLIDSEGARHEIEVGAATEFGLDDATGQRWVATLGSDGEVAAEAHARLVDHQRRFAPVTATLEGGVASKVVEAVSTGVSANLGYLFAAFAISWVGFFLYVFWVSRKQRFLQLELEQLRSSK